MIAYNLFYYIFFPIFCGIGAGFFVCLIFTVVGTEEKRASRNYIIKNGKILLASPDFDRKAEANDYIFNTIKRVSILSSILLISISIYCNLPEKMAELDRAFLREKYEKCEKLNNFQYKKNGNN